MNDIFEKIIGLRNTSLQAINDIEKTALRVIRERIEERDRYASALRVLRDTMVSGGEKNAHFIKYINEVLDK
jgi:hypothetical protein